MFACTEGLDKQIETDSNRQEKTGETHIGIDEVDSNLQNYFGPLVSKHVQVHGVRLGVQDISSSGRWGVEPRVYGIRAANLWVSRFRGSWMRLPWEQVRGSGFLL